MPLFVTLAHFSIFTVKNGILSCQFHVLLITAKLIDFECHMTAPEIRLVLTVGFDPKGYFPGGFNLFKLANVKLFGFFHLYYIDHLLVYGKNLYVPQLLLCSIDIE